MHQEVQGNIMNINQLKIKLRELESNLESDKVRQVLQNQKFSLDKLNESIKKYFGGIEQIKDEDLLKTIEIKVNELITFSNSGNFDLYSHPFINAANFLINNTPNLKNNLNDFHAFNEMQISEDEFTKRYEKLIEALNFEGEEANLKLETPSEKKPFKVFKTKTKSLAIYASSSKEPMKIAADRLLEVAFKRKEPTYASYEKVLISKIMDNSIFDFFTESMQNDLIEAMKNKLLNNENELLIVKNELEKIQKDNQELEEKKQKFDEIFVKSTKIDETYKNTIQAAEDKAKLGASVSYWNEKKYKHKRQFWIFIGIAIFAIIALISVLFFVVQNHTVQINQSIKTETTTKNNNGLESGKTIKAKKQQENESIQKNNIKSEAKEEQKEPFDYTKLAWYALILFASSSTFWIIRITVKIALSNLHLSEDAYERVVMIQTYLSFVQEGQLKDEKDKQLVLSPLFRPSNIGIIQDESSVTVADIVTAFKK